MAVCGRAIDPTDGSFRWAKRITRRKSQTHFCEDHRRHVRERSLRFSEAPKRLLTKGKVFIADLIDDDKAILMAMSVNENVTCEA